MTSFMDNPKQLMVVAIVQQGGVMVVILKRFTSHHFYVTILNKLFTYVYFCHKELADFF